MPAVKLKAVQTGDTATGPSKVSAYCCPSAPFGPPPTYTGAAMNEDGSEHLYWTEIDSPVVNFGVSVVAQQPGVARSIRSCSARRTRTTFRATPEPRPT